MNKNTIIGILIAIVVIGGGYYLMNKDTTEENGVVKEPLVANNNTKTPIVQPINNTQPSAPFAETNKSNSSSNATVSLGGIVNPNGASTTYWFEYGESTSMGNRNSAQSIGSGYYPISAPAFITGLKENTTYYYRLSAQNKFATTKGEMYTFQTNSNPPPRVVSTTVRTNNATNISRTTADINGEVNPNGTATSYWFEYGNDKNFGLSTQIRDTNSGSSFMNVSTSISQLEPLTRYYFRINAQNQFGTVNGTVLNFTTTGPAASRKPNVETSAVKNVSSSDATLTGNINPNGADTTYWFEYGKNTIVANLMLTSTPKGTIQGTNNQNVQINVNALEPNTKYSYHLIGVNNNGTTYGEEISFTTKK